MRKFEQIKFRNRISFKKSPVTDDNKFFHPYMMKLVRRPIKYDERISEKYFVHSVITKPNN